MLSQLIVLALSSFILAAVASKCDVEPIRIPIQDTQVLGNVKGSNMIGMRATVGSPAQSILMLPWPELNNTWIYDYNPYCDDSIIWSDLICNIRRGGYFYENASSTWTKASSLIDAGGARQETEDSRAELGIPDLLTKSLGGTDTISLGGANLTNWPIGIPRLNWDHGYTTLHALGLGSNSTFLQSLVDAGQAASKVWSIFWGRMWVDDWLDGSVVFGGYDSELVIGDNYTQSLDYSEGTGCWTGMKVTITDIVLNIRDGSKVSIFPTNYALPTCIVPQRQLLLEAPSSIVENFEKKTGMSSTESSYGLHWSAVQYLAANAFDGDLTISLSSGLSVTVANDQFLTPFVQVDYNGARFLNESIKELLINPTDQPPTLGRYFLTAAYLMVNHDSNTFTMWQGNPSSSSNLVTVVSEKAAEACGNVTGVVQPSATAGITPSASATSGLAGSSPSESGTKSPTGVIAGVTVGGVAFLVALGLSVFFLLRLKRRQNEAQLRPELANEKPGMGAQVVEPNKLESQSTDRVLSSNSVLSHELDSTKPLSELAPYNNRFDAESRGDHFSIGGSSQATYEMDGHVYTFRP